MQIQMIRDVTCIGQTLRFVLFAGYYDVDKTVSLKHISAF